MKKIFTNTLLHAVLVIFAVLFLVPLIWSLISSFKPEHRILQDVQSLRAFFPYPLSLDNYRDVFRRVPFFLYFFNSCFITLTIAGVGLLINAAAGFVFALVPFPGRSIVFACVVSLIIIPFEIIIIPLFLQINMWGWVNTYAGLIVPFFANAFSIYLLRQAFMDLPVSLFESAEIDGCGLFRSFIHIGLPLVKPALAAAFIIDIATRWGDFTWPLLVSTDESKRPLQLGLAYFFHQPPIKWGNILAYSVLATVPVAILFAFAQKYIVKGIAVTGIKE